MFVHIFSRIIAVLTGAVRTRVGGVVDGGGGSGASVAAGGFLATGAAGAAACAAGAGGAAAGALGRWCLLSTVSFVAGPRGGARSKAAAMRNGVGPRRAGSRALGSARRQGPAVHSPHTARRVPRQAPSRFRSGASRASLDQARRSSRSCATTAPATSPNSTIRTSSDQRICRFRSGWSEKSRSSPPSPDRLTPGGIT